MNMNSTKAEVKAKLPNQRTNTDWDDYLAVSIAEGFSEEESTAEQMIEAWAYLIMTGMCWGLQGWFGRTAQSLIDSQHIERDGTINWNVLSQ